MKEFFQKNVYFKLFACFFKLGLFTFGGGTAMLPLLQEKVCDEYGWMNEEEVLDCLAVSQSLPGVIAINMATYTGYFKKGLKGALAATFGMILPSFLIIVIIAMFLTQFESNPYVAGALSGIKGATVGLIAYAVIKLGKQVLKNPFAWIIAILSFIFIGILSVNVVWIILASIAAGIIYTMVTAKKLPPQAEQNLQSGGEKK